MFGQRVGRVPAFLLAGVCLAPLVAAGPVRPREPAACFEATPWPEADRLFRRDPHWVGADAAGSIPLGDGRTCWLFGDSWIDSSGHHDRRSGRMVRNSVAVQHGADPSQARIEFAWRRDARGTPASFFPDEADAWYWPGHGIRLGDRVVVFLMRVAASDTGLGFRHAGWGAFEITRPDEEPSRWRVRRLRTPRNALGIAVGSAAVLLHGGHVYAFSSREPVTPHPMHLARWRAKDVARGELSRLEWWGGSRHGWLPDGAALPPEPVFTDGQSELSVHLDESRSRFVSFQTVGFGAADIAVRDAPELTGPWSDPNAFHRPAEHGRENIMLYAARAHPELRGADLVLTYATNSFRFEDQLADSLLYYPRFLRLRRCRDRG